MENADKDLAKLEALLFVQGEPLAVKKIGGVLGWTPEEVSQVILELKNNLTQNNRGLILLEEGERIQLVTKPEMSPILQNFIKDQLSEELSPASLETLALIAYLGPISRSQLEYQRGINSSFILRSLLLRGLVERTADSARPSGYLYNCSFDLLRHLGVQRKQDLPDYHKFQSIFKAAGTETPT